VKVEDMDVAKIYRSDISSPHLSTLIPIIASRAGQTEKRARSGFRLHFIWRGQENEAGGRNVA
jgi:hypothetical protein